MAVTQYQRYQEHPAAALESVLAHLTRVGASLSGIGGNDSHTYGYHLSQARLLGTGKASDYSLAGADNTPVADARAACAIDIGMDWPACHQWLDWLRAERHAGRLPHVVELIGSTDGQTARYAAGSTGWQWTAYHGEGHVSWCHVAVGRRYATATDFGDALLGRWTATGLITQEDDMASVPQEQWDRARTQLDALSDAVNGGKGSGYTESILRKDHGYQIDEIDRRVNARLAVLEAKVDQLLAAAASKA